MDRLAAALDIDPGRAAAPERARVRRRAADGPGDHRRVPGRGGHSLERPRSTRPSRRSSRATRCGCPAVPATPRTARASAAASASRSASRTSATRRGSTTPAPPVFGSSVVGGEPRAEVDCAAAEVGQGVVERSMLQVARTELGVDDVVARARGSTVGVGSAGSASASRMTWMAAGAVQLACRALRSRSTGAQRRRGRRRARLPASRGRWPLDPGDGSDHRTGPSHVSLRLRGACASWRRSTSSSA